MLLGIFPAGCSGSSGASGSSGSEGSSPAAPSWATVTDTWSVPQEMRTVAVREAVSELAEAESSAEISPASPADGLTVSHSPPSTEAVQSAVAVKEMVVSVAAAGRVICASECRDTEPFSGFSWQPTAISAAAAVAVRVRVKCFIFSQILFMQSKEQ